MKFASLPGTLFYTNMALMKRISLFKIFLGFTFIASGQIASAQKKPKSPEKQQEEFIKLQKERDKENESSLESDRKKHLSIQTRETRKRMKANKKRSRRLKENKHEKNLFQRIFTAKPKGR